MIRPAMRIAARSLVAAVLALVCAGRPAAQPAAVLLTGGRVIPGDGRPPIENAAVVVQDGRIVQVDVVGRVAAPSGVQRIDASGKTLIAGEFDFEALRMEDSVRVSEVKFDRESYSPGQSARIVMTLEGRSPYGYLLEVTAKDENGATLINESRKGIYSKGKSIQEFQLEIPTEANGAIGVEFKAYGVLIKKLFDSGTRDVIIGDNQDNDNKEDSRL